MALIPFKATEKKGITCGEMFDLSAEMSQKRESKDGKDRVKEKAQKDSKSYVPAETTSKNLKH